ncbi:MAG TPA: hypothetical protein VFJ78_00555 [Gaiellaceae bacterium]|nr:hypothetical protein [Gaiellaceae bacterium]
MIVILLMGLLAAATPGAASPAWSADGLHAAYVHGGRICTTERCLAPGSDPAWSPDGTRLAWVDGGRLLVGPADGSQAPVELATGLTAGAAWSPDGTRLAFERRAGAGAALMVVSAAGGTPTRLGLGASTFAPSWVAGTIAYVDDHRLFLWPGHRLVSRGAVVSAPSRAAGKVAYGTTRGIAVGRRLIGRGSTPVLSTDGARLAFRFRGALWQMNADGTCRRRIGAYADPAWKPGLRPGRLRC